MFHGIKPSLILVFTVVFLSFLPSCGWFEDEKPIKKPQTIKKTIPTILKQTKEQETEGTKANKEIDICQQALKQEKAIKKIEQVSDSLATVVIESNSITNEDSLAKWLKDFTKELYKGTGCILEQVGFSVKIDEFSYFQGIINRGDFGLYKKQKISEAEWVRRFEIKKMATSEALVESLRKARRALDNEKALKLVNQVLDDDFSNVSAREIKANILLDQKQNVLKDKDKFNTLLQMRDLAIEMEKCLKKSNIDVFGELLNENWNLKKTLSNKISSRSIDEIYNLGIKNGAVGGKVLGAGGGGFLLFYCNKKLHDNLRYALKNLKQLIFDFDNTGSQIIFKEKNIKEKLWK